MGKLGKFKSPVWFTKEKYESYKRSGISDHAICEDILFVSDKVLKRWKRELKIDPYKCRVEISLDGSELLDRILEMKGKGMTYAQIGEVVGKSGSAVSGIVYRGRRDGKVRVRK